MALETGVQLFLFNTTTMTKLVWQQLLYTELNGLDLHDNT